MYGLFCELFGQEGLEVKVLEVKEVAEFTKKSNQISLFSGSSDRSHQRELVVFLLRVSL